MTTLIKHGNFLYTDSKWAEEAPDELLITTGRVKAFIHPTKTCVIAYSGNITSQATFVAIDALVANVIENFDDILIKEVPTRKLRDELTLALLENDCTIFVFFKEITLQIIHHPKATDIFLRKNNELLCAGSGSMMARANIARANMDMFGVFKEIYRRDPLSGGQPFMISLENLKDVSATKTGDE